MALSAYSHDDVMAWKHFPHFCPFVGESTGHWSSLWGLINSRFTGDLRHLHFHMISLQWTWKHLLLYTFNNIVVSNAKKLLPFTHSLKCSSIPMTLIDETQACVIHLHRNTIYWTCSGRNILSYSVIQNWVISRYASRLIKQNLTLTYLGYIHVFYVCLCVVTWWHRIKYMYHRSALPFFHSTKFCYWIPVQGMRQISIFINTCFLLSFACRFNCIFWIWTKCN